MAHSLARSATLIVLITVVAGLPGTSRQAAAGDGSSIFSEHALKEIPPNDVRFSDMGASDGNGAYDAFNPVVAYDSIRREYLVIWDGDDDTSPLVNGEFEIFGQRLRETGVEIDGDFRISHM